MAHEPHDHVDHVDDGGGFGAGVLVGILLLILVVAILLLFYVGPNVFNVNVNVRSWLPIT